ncbi:MAG: hypothetical protein ACKOCH_01725, partial [Bacteroidota bacterium]
MADEIAEAITELAMMHLDISEPADLLEAVQLDELGKAKSTRFRNALVFNFGEVMQAMLTGAINATAGFTFPWAGVAG